MRKGAKTVQPYSDPALIARCLDPSQADFPCLKRVWNARTITNGVQICPFSGMTISWEAQGDPNAFWTASGYDFRVPTNDAHVAGELGGDIYNPGTKDFALIVSGYSPSGAADGSNLLLVLGAAASGPSIRINGAYDALGGESYSITRTFTNYLKVAANNTINVASRSMVEATVYRQADNDLDYYLADTNGNYYTGNKGAESTGTIAGGIGQLDTYAECNGYGTYDSRFRAIYILEFNDAPSAAFMKAASLWMASREDGALYPGFMGMT